LLDIDDERKIRAFLDKRLAAEVEGEALGAEFKGYVFKITGGYDKQGFPMKQGVLVPGRVSLLLSGDTGCYKPLRVGERRRKSVRGCIVSQEISVLNLVVVKKGDEELPGLTDKQIPRRLGPKRASKIRKLFNLDKKDDVRKYVIRRELTKPTKSGKKRSKAPKIQRLVTPLTLQRRRHRVALKKRHADKAKLDAAEYAKLLAQRAKEKRQSVIASRRSVSQKRESVKKESVKKDHPAAVAKPEAKAAPKAAPAKPEAKAAAKGAKKPAAKPAGKPAAATAKPEAKHAAAKPAAAKPAAAAKPKEASKAAPAKPKEAKPKEAKPAAPKKAAKK